MFKKDEWPALMKHEITYNIGNAYYRSYIISRFGNINMGRNEPNRHRIFLAN